MDRLRVLGVGRGVYVVVAMLNPSTPFLFGDPSAEILAAAERRR
jgi:hypothetical protein